MPDHEDYPSLAGPGLAEIIIKKSRFIGQAAPVRCADEALAFVQDVKAAHRDATHNVWAYALRAGGLCRCSDDGEPQGTAGLPVLEALQKRELNDCAVVVTRYFGGVLLGAGGLVRAYSQASTAALNAAGVVTMTLCAIVRVCCGYAFYGKVQMLIPVHDGAVLDIVFADDVTVTLRLQAQAVACFIAEVKDASHGNAVCDVLYEEVGVRG